MDVRGKKYPECQFGGIRISNNLLQKAVHIKQTSEIKGKKRHNRRVIVISQDYVDREETKYRM